MLRKGDIRKEADGNIAVGTKVAYYKRDKEEMYKKALPKEVIHFLEYECAERYAYVRIYALYRKVGSKEKLISAIKISSKIAMVDSFGPDHPCREELKFISV